MKRYIYNHLIILDTWLNVIFCGSPYETCSSRLGRYYDTSRTARVVADCIDWIAYRLVGEMNHCKSNILLESHYKDLEVIS
jgi:hypothetical protein